MTSSFCPAGVLGLGIGPSIPFPAGLVQHRRALIYNKSFKTSRLRERDG